MFGVAAGGEGFVQDAVNAQFAGGQVRAQVMAHPARTDAVGGEGGADVDEQALVAGGRPSAGAVLEVGGQAFADRGSEDDDPVVNGDVAAVEVGQLQVAESV
ncbi:hypothetical protein [Streptomyces sp. NPDC005507]|uniref:hypothetical protein n=1 Tax=Streptomyces sp. NPDC005507 TaxID=3154885 RepID=UPI0033B3C798